MRFTPQMRDLNWMLARPITHRGLHNRVAGIFENTSSAFAAAIENDYAIECDLQLTGDGEAILFHDHDVDRIMHATGHVNCKTTKEMKSLKYRVGSDIVQTLSELLEQVAGRVALVIEIKSLWNNDDTLPLRALKVLESYNGAYSLMSFDPDVVACLAEVAPHVVRGIVTDRTLDPDYQNLPLAKRYEMRSISHVQRTRPHFISTNFAELPFPPIQRIRAQGFPVITWTINSPEAAKQAMRYCDQITFEGFLA